MGWLGVAWIDFTIRGLSGDYPGWDGVAWDGLGVVWTDHLVKNLINSKEVDHLVKKFIIQ